MSIATGTLSLNAAFLQEIKADNTALRGLLELLREIVSDPAALERHGETFTRGACDLRDQLALHFSLEEAFGYFEDAIAQAPRLSSQAAQLRSEHEGLFVEACELAELAEECRYERPTHRVPRRLAQRFRQFDRRFLAHEARENRLILEAFDDDIGVGD